MKAIVWTGELEVRDDVEVRGPRQDEVRVRIVNAGLCHSDVSVIDGTIMFPPPVVLGHEGAGVVEEVGAAVTKASVGDPVGLTTLGNCGRCAACDRGQPTHCRDTMGRLSRPFTVGGEKAYSFANTGVFTEEVVVKETQAVVIDPEVPFEAACLIGCAVVTGAGAVLNRAKVQPGQTVAVIGAGGIGQSTIQAARIAAAGRIVVIDANPETIWPFLTDPAKHVEWLGTVADIDPRPGGTYRVNVGGEHQSAGEYVEVVPQEKVVFTFGWEEKELRASRMKVETASTP